MQALTLLPVLAVGEERLQTVQILLPNPVMAVLAAHRAAVAAAEVPG